MGEERSERALFEQLVQQHGSAVQGVCRSVLRDEHLGADAAQEAFLRLWATLEAGPRPRHFGAWLRRVAVRASLDLVRAGRARQRAHEVAPPALERDAPPPAAAQEGELRERFERALATLPEGQRTVFALRHDAGLPLSEVAEVLGLALPTVRTQFARAALALAHKLRAFAPDPRAE